MYKYITVIKIRRNVYIHTDDALHYDVSVKFYQNYFIIHKIQTIQERGDWEWHTFSIKSIDS